jgi:hypothetical protein
MATDKQIEANRLNALKSTGPRTREGKSITRRNAFKHGIFAEAHTLIGEDNTAFEALRDDYLDRFHPSGPEEETLVANLINHSWFLARFRRLEAITWNMRLEDPISRYPLASAHIFALKELEFLQRRINSTNRQFHRDLEALTRLQATRKLAPDAPRELDLHNAAAAPDPEPVPQPSSSEALPSEIGFVPPNLEEPRNDPAFPLLADAPRDISAC